MKFEDSESLDGGGLAASERRQNQQGVIYFKLLANPLAPKGFSRSV